MLPTKEEVIREVFNRLPSIRENRNQSEQIISMCVEIYERWQAMNEEHDDALEELGFRWEKGGHERIYLSDPLQYSSIRIYFTFKSVKPEEAQFSWKGKDLTIEDVITWYDQGKVFWDVKAGTWGSKNLPADLVKEVVTNVEMTLEQMEVVEKQRSSVLKIVTSEAGTPDTYKE